MPTSVSTELVILAVVLSAVIVVGAWAAVQLLLDLRRAIKEEEPADWPAESFDASAVGPRIEQVRRDHSSSVVRPLHDEAQRRGRVETARRAVGQRSYFQHVDPEPQSQESVSAPV